MKGFAELISNFIEARYNFIFKLLSNKAAKNILNKKRSYRKY
jgi:hypothetical protein